MPLYQSFGSLAQHFPICARASLWDAGYITGLYLAIALVHKDYIWVRQRPAVGYVIAIVASLLVAWWIEFDALRDGRWAYREQMPLVFGAGLTPLLQLPLLSLLTYEISRRLPFMSFSKLHG